MGDLMGRWQSDLKKLVGDDFTKNLKTKFTTYEKKVQDLVKDLDVKGKEAKKKGEVQLEKWAKQLKKSRTDIEKRVTTLVNSEANKLGKQFGEVVKNLRGLAAAETVTKAKPTSKSAKSSTGKKKARAGAAKKSKKVTADVGVVTASAEPVSSVTLN